MHRVLILLLGLAAASGCATMTSKPDETIEVTSEPSGAEASVQCGAETTSVVTPARIAVARRTTDCAVTFRKAGYETETVALDQGMNAWTWGNLPIAIVGVAGLGVSGFSNDPDQGARAGAGLVLIGLGGFVVDRLTGRGRDHDPKHLHVKLRPVTQGVQSYPASTNHSLPSRYMR